MWGDLNETERRLLSLAIHVEVVKPDRFAARPVSFAHAPVALLL